MTIKIAYDLIKKAIYLGAIVWFKATTLYSKKPAMNKDNKKSFWSESQVSFYSNLWRHKKNIYD